MPSENLTLYGVWSMTERFYSTINFVSNMPEAQTESITALIGNNITLPTFAPIVADNGVTQITHTFVGWKNANNEFVELSQMPSENLTLYAAFNTETKYYHTLSFNTNLNSLNESTQTILEGESLTLPTYAPQNFAVDGNHIKYTFVGWCTDSSLNNLFTSSTMPSSNTILYAKWNVEIVCSLKVYDKGNLIVDAYEIAGTKVEIVGADQDTELYNNSSFTGNAIIPELISGKYYVTITTSTTLYVKTYSFSVNYNKDGVSNVNVQLHANEDISGYLTTFNNQIINRSTYNTDINFLGYNTTRTTMPKQDLSIAASWETINWATITFNTTIAKPSLSKTATETLGSQPSINSVRVNLNNNLSYSSTFTSYTGTTSYQLKKGWSDASFTLKIVGWNKSAVSNISSVSIGISGLYYSFNASNRASSYTASSVTITGHTTLYAVWAIQ